MVRICITYASGLSGIPHARGDGPCDLSTLVTRVTYSPRAWGWSIYVHHRFGLVRVFPTRVGMVLCVDNSLPQRVVFPTRVGMVLIAPACAGCRSRIPHARGDGPDFPHITGLPNSYSPRAWGWSGRAAGPARRVVVFPTRVGMVLPRRSLVSADIGIPHARGDGPSMSVSTLTATEYSPRAWGWSDTRSSECVRFGVFPTRVGMVRSRSTLRRCRLSIPPARGRGLPKATQNAYSIEKGSAVTS